MQKSSALNFSLAGMLLLGTVYGQQNSAPNSSTSSSIKTQKTRAAKTSQAAVLNTQKDKLSYAIGMKVAKGFKEQKLDINLDSFLRGLKETLAGGQVLLSDDEVKAVFTQAQNEQRQREKDEVETNKKAGDAFLAANKLKDGVVTLPSGLQYKILTQGTGPKPTTGDTVICNYRGTLIDGTEFDSSYKRGQPATFPLTGVIRGWVEALQLMPVGSKWELFIPPDLAYGAAASKQLPANSTLIFEVELLSIKDRTPDGASTQSKDSTVADKIMPFCGSGWCAEIFCKLYNSEE